MSRSRPGRLLVVVLLALGLGASLAAATPAQVIRDFQADGRLDQRHSASDLRAAADAVQGTPLADGLNGAIEDRLFVDLAGLRPSRASAPPAPPSGTQRPAEVSRSADGGSSLPGFVTGPAGRPAGGLPVLIMVLGGLAVALVLTGATSAISRRRTDRTAALRAGSPRL